ncbi:hypothetical protein P171DRAFT_486468 [Karstenula rhodostoma CBS 690.94]|uniref:Uncharacterized protein n=1 Tax=Karstenula rhodostoma CBS 690.94 TaxID=1392251 RepID=A0A9P4PGW4_9PLEO|nr:hypothetical protein P171DRAFT_486468 [Karstenula rhodostoma CBS 690.94]
MRNRLSEQLAEQRSFLGSRVALLAWPSRGFKGRRNRNLLTGEQGFNTKEETTLLYGALGIVKDARLRHSKASRHAVRRLVTSCSSVGCAGTPTTSHSATLNYPHCRILVSMPRTDLNHPTTRQSTTAMPYMLQLGNQQNNILKEGAQSHDTGTVNRVGREHAPLDSPEVGNKFSVPRCCANIEERTKSDSELVQIGFADANSEYRETIMNEKTVTPTREALDPRDSQLAKNWRLGFFQCPSFGESLFRPKRTRHDLDHNELDLILHAETGHQHAVLFQTPISHNRTAIISACFLLAAASAVYESSRPGPPHHFCVNAHNNHISSRLELLQHLTRSLAPPFVFTLAMAIVYHLNVGHRFQDFFMLVGLFLGVLGGMAKYRDLQDTALRVVPWGLIAALGASMAVHRAWEHRKEVLQIHVTLV